MDKWPHISAALLAGGLICDHGPVLIWWVVVQAQTAKVCAVVTPKQTDEEHEALIMQRLQTSAVHSADFAQCATGRV